MSLFQSLKGIIDNWNLVTTMQNSRLIRFLFQSLKGIIDNWHMVLVLFRLTGYVSIPKRDY